SPDGSFAALSVHRALLDKDEYEGNLWIVPTAGGEPRQLTTAGKDSAPKVSPDGKRVLFTSKREIGKDDKGNALYMIPTDGGLVARRATDRVRRANGRPTPLSPGPLHLRGGLQEEEAAHEAQHGDRLRRLVSRRPATCVPRKRLPSRLRIPQSPLVDRRLGRFADSPGRS